VSFLSEYVRPGDTVVEFGSGRSTMWFARAVGTQGKVISVEESQEWQEEVSRRLVAAGLPQADVQPSANDAVNYVQSAAMRLQGKADTILIDGAVRDACAVWALTAVKPGGIIVIDNIQHYLPHASRCPLAIPVGGEPRTALWAQFGEAVKTWRRYWTTDGVNDTVIFFAPGN
jgi:predicted O-methyltransferase YrrM